MRVLLVEDERDLANAIARGLRRDGLAVDIAFDGAEALEKAAVHPYDVVVLDRDLPAVHGDDVCRELVAGESECRILMLTAAAAVHDRIDGLDLGADDYLAKPFDFGELRARLRALGRRARPAVQPVLERGGVGLDTARRSASREGADAGPDAQGVRRPPGAARGGGRSREPRGAAGPGVGRAHRPVHQRRARHDHEAAQEPG